METLYTYNRQDRLFQILLCNAKNECTKIAIIQNVKEASEGFWSYTHDQTRHRTTVAHFKDPNGQIVREDEQNADLLYDVLHQYL